MSLPPQGPPHSGLGQRVFFPFLCTPDSCDSALPSQILIPDAVTDPKGKQGLQVQGGAVAKHMCPLAPWSLPWRGSSSSLLPSSVGTGLALPLSTGHSGMGYTGFLSPSLALSLSFCPVQVPRISCHLAQELYL